MGFIGGEQTFVEFFFCFNCFEALSPVSSHVTVTSAGLVTIRACQNQGVMFDEFCKLFDKHTRSSFTHSGLSRWFALRLDIFLVVFISLTIHGCILFKRNFCFWACLCIIICCIHTHVTAFSDTLGMNQNLVGLTLVYIIQILNQFQRSIRAISDVENSVCWLMTGIRKS
jgi:hypothetical protein